jgi:peroxiredoxin
MLGNDAGTITMQVGINNTANDQVSVTFAKTDSTALGVTYGALENQRDTFVGRVTMLLDADGELLLEYVDSIDVGEHPAKVLEDCEALFGG